ncbi:MAG: hypothetical protein IJ269_01825, partial [Bacteroidales bacterium]|nr:hypothetical protein [Bacteroidales bacterium]
GATKRRGKVEPNAGATSIPTPGRYIYNEWPFFGQRKRGRPPTGMCRLGNTLPSGQTSVFELRYTYWQRKRNGLETEV